MTDTAVAIADSPGDAEDMEGGDSGADERLGRRIRHLRKARELGLKDVAERSGFSISFISQIERGKSSASVRVLVRIASALNVSVSALFEEAGEPQHATIQRRESRRHISFRDTSVSKELVSPPRAGRNLDVYLITIEPGGSTGSDPYAHPGEEAGMVLRGSLELEVEGETHVLREGDGFSFESRRLHKFGNPGTGLTQVIWVNARLSGE